MINEDEFGVINKSNYHIWYDNTDCKTMIIFGNDRVELDISNLDVSYVNYFVGNYNKTYNLWLQSLTHKGIHI